jgi:hypothetical protein
MVQAQQIFRTTGPAVARGSVAPANIFASLGLDEEAVEMIVSAGSKYVFEDDPAAWTSETPFHESFIASIVKTVVSLPSASTSASKLVKMLTPLLAFHSEMKATKKRLGYTELDGPSRTTVDVLLMNGPMTGLSDITLDTIRAALTKRWTGNVHVLTDKLLP